MHKSTNERETPKVVEKGRFHRAIDRLYTRHGIVLTLGIAFQLIVLMTMIVPPLTTKLTGDTVLLRIVPVDPRDFFRGDYVILGYDFSRLPVNAIASTQADELQGKMVYVSIVLDSDGKHWRASSFKLEKPTAGKFLCGRIKGGNQIEFGIESFFVQQGQGLQYEDAARNRSLSAEIALSQNGKAVLKRLVIHDAPHVVVAPKPVIDIQSFHLFHWQAERRLVGRRIDEKVFATMAKETGTAILDTRSSKENRSERIKGSIHLPSDSVSYEELKRLVPDPSTRILLYSGSNIAERVRVPHQPSTDQYQVLDAEIKLSVPVFLMLYVYGYQNVWELNAIIDTHQSELEIEIDSSSPSG